MTDDSFQLKLTEDEQLIRKTDLSRERFATLENLAPPPFDIEDILTALQAMFWDIRHPVPSAWGGHIPLLFALMTLLRPRRYVELGVHNGGSFFAACQGARQSSVSTQCVAIDNWVGEPHAGYYGSEVFADFRRKLEQYRDYAGYVRNDFDAAATQFEIGSIDMLHIDGFHTARAVRHDFEAWIAKLSSVGVVLFHDINEFRTDFGVWRFWRKVKESYPFLELGHSHGLGILVVGEKNPMRTNIDGTGISLLSPPANDFLQIICGGVGHLSWGAATGRGRSDPQHDGNVVGNGGEVEWLRGRIAALESSTSWKITKPIRAIKQLLSR